MKQLLIITLLGLTSYVSAQTLIAVQDFETTPATPILSIATSANMSTSSSNAVKPDSDNSHAAEGTNGYINTSLVATGEFTTAAVSTLNYVNITVELRLAALANSSSNGMDGGDDVTIAISIDNGVTYSKEIKIIGKSNAKWGFLTGTGIASVNYDGDDAAKVVAPSSGGVRTTDGYSTVQVTNIAPTANLKIKVLMNNDHVDEQWAVDYIKVTGDDGVGFNSTISEVNEGASGSAAHQMDLTMVKKEVGDVTVNITDAGTGTAVSGSDYNFSATSVTFSISESYPNTKTITVNILGNTVVGSDKTIVLNMAITVGSASTYNTTHTITILEDECATIAIDNFTDNDLSNSPSWSGDRDDFGIVTDGILPDGVTVTDGTYLGSNNNIGNAALVTSSSNVSEWKFSWASGDFSPSTSNYFGVVLMSDVRLSGDIAKNGTGLSWNGYYLQVGSTGSTDKIDFYKRTGTTSTLLGTFTTSVYAADALESGVDIRVTRSASGVFELFYTNGSFQYASDPSTSGGTFTDNTHTSSCYFGVFTRFNNPSADRRIFLDNLNDNSDMVLPVELTDFWATPLDNNVSLHWETASELNNDYFIVERRTVDSRFEKVGQVNGYGTTFESQFYEFTDSYPLSETMYYRLKQVDFDGAFTYSDVISVMPSFTSKPLQVFPNPVDHQATVRFSNPLQQRAMIRLFNTNGQRIYESVSSTEQAILNLGDLPNGVYFLRMQVGQEIYQKKVIIQR